MPPGQLWKAGVNQLDKRFDLVRDRLDQLIEMDNNKQNFKVFNNGNTMVEVSIKTRKASGGSSEGDNKRWGEALHDSRTAPLPPHPKQKKHYAQSTRASKLKALKRTSPKSAKVTAEAGE